MNVFVRSSRYLVLILVSASLCSVPAEAGTWNGSGSSFEADVAADVNMIRCLTVANQQPSMLRESVVTASTIDVKRSCQLACLGSAGPVSEG